MDFYGLGDVSISKEDRVDSELALANRHAFILRVNGDLNGVLLLTSDHLPVESDTSSGLELLNVLSGHVVDLLHEEGLDLVISPPSVLGVDARTRLESLALLASRSWRGSLSGARSFEFTLQLLAHHAGTDSLLRVNPPSQDYLTEKMPCLDHSLDS
jgi:hypothetical protein